MMVRINLSGARERLNVENAMTFLALAAIAVQSVYLSGCGSSPTPVTSFAATTTAYPGTPFYPIPGYVLGPQLGFTGSCTTTTPMAFAQACSQCFGGYLYTYGGAQVCRFSGTSLPVVAAPTSGAAPIPVLDPTNPSGPLSYPVYAVSSGYGSYYPTPATNPLYLKRGYRISFSASGTWDYNTNGYVTCGNGNDYTLAGVKQGTGQTFTNQSNGQTMGLYGSDGTEVFFLGTSLSSKTINNDGVLRIGINVDPTTFRTACYAFPNWRVTVQGCVDAAYNVVGGCG